MKIVLDGYVFCQNKTGMYRYAYEILRELDKLLDNSKIELIIPIYATIDFNFKNIQVIRYGRVKGVLWTQISLLIYCVKHCCVSVGFNNTTPIFRPGFTVVHDIGYKVMKKTYRNLYGIMSSMWHRLNYWVIAKSGNDIITVSETSKREIIEIYHVPSNRIYVISNGWQHYKRIVEESIIKKKYPKIIEGDFFFSIGSREERKNFRWIINVAENHPECFFVIAGMAVKNAKDKLNIGHIKNVLLVGYVTDGEAKWLYNHCRAFIFPSLYEGFGLPLLEAMSVGAKMLCANISCIPEICRDSVVYFDPYSYDIDLNRLLNQYNIKDTNCILEGYSWEKSAFQFSTLIKKWSKNNL